MAITQLITINVLLQGDGVATSFTLNPNKLFGTSFGEGEVLTNPSVIPVGAQFEIVPGGWPAGQSATVDAYGNVTLTFASAPPVGSGYVTLQLIYDSGTTLGGTASWTSATPVNTALQVALQGATNILLTLAVSGTITAGSLSFQVSVDGANWFGVQGVQASGFQPLGGWTIASGQVAVIFNVAGYSFFRVQLTPAITGTGTATVSLQSTINPSTNLLVAGLAATYTSTAPSPGSGAVSPVQIDGYGNVFINDLRRSQVVPTTGNIASTTPATMCAAQGAGIFADLASLVCTLREGASANVFFGVLISDGTNTYRFNFLSQDVVTFQSASALAVNFDPPIPATNANTAWTIALTSATDSPNVDWVAMFVKQKAE